MRFEVLLTEDAERDLEAIHHYITEHDSAAKAGYVLDRLTTVIHRLAMLPDRGAYPPELQALGIREFRQVFFKPFRVIYSVAGAQVLIFVIADGRRDLQALLGRRLLGA